jgi:hypothetical protein
MLLSPGKAHPFANLPSSLGVSQLRCQVFGPSAEIGPNRSVFPDPAESFPDERI